MDDSDETIRRVLDHVGRDLDPSILIGRWATHLRVGVKLSKADQKAIRQWRREWTQAALAYASPQTFAPRTL